MSCFVCRLLQKELEKCLREFYSISETFYSICSLKEHLPFGITLDSFVPQKVQNFSVHYDGFFETSLQVNFQCSLWMVTRKQTTACRNLIFCLLFPGTITVPTALYPELFTATLLFEQLPSLPSHPVGVYRFQGLNLPLSTLSSLTWHLVGHTKACSYCHQNTPPKLPNPEYRLLEQV